MSLAVLAILLDCIVDGDVLVEQELAVERFDGSVCGFKAVEGDKGKPFWLSAGGVPGYLRKAYDTAKSGKSLVEQAFIDSRVEATDKEIGADIDLLTIVGGFVDTDRLAVELETVHDFAGIVSILLCLEFGKGVALMGLGDAVLG